MSYVRVIPRDLFNEANLLKCYGRVALLLENVCGLDRTGFPEDNFDSFEIDQSPDSGATYVANMPFYVQGSEYCLWRPLNSRSEWPLYLTDYAGDEISVFDDGGNFTSEFKEFITRTK